MIAISPQFFEKSRDLIVKHKLRFEILRDPNNAVSAVFGLRWNMPEDLQKLYLQFGFDLPACNGDRSWSLPLPARYIIDQTGTVRYARTDPDYTKRPEPEETLEALLALG